MSENRPEVEAPAGVELQSLPDTWTWCYLGDLLSRIETGKSFRCDERPPAETEYGIVKVSAVTWGVYDESESKTITEAARINEAYLVKPGDFLFSRANTIELVGACVLVHDTTRRLLLSDKILRFVFKADFKNWVNWMLKSPLGRVQTEALATGNQESMRNIGQERIRQICVPIPPEREMTRIESKLGELFSRIDEGERALERVQKLVERYRQSILKAAVTGELTREWREKNKDRLESGESLLKRILNARREGWEKAELEKMVAKGITLTNDKWKQRYEEPTLPDTTDLPDLPEGWAWASIDQVGIVSGGLTKNQKRDDHKLTRPYLRVANVYANRLELDDVHEIGVTESELDRIILQTGDMLVVEGNGSIDQIGRVALWDGSLPGCVHQNHLIKVRCTPALPSWYLLIWCLSPLGRDQIRRVASSTAGLHTLSISKVQALPVPIPNAGELSTILDRFEQMDSLVESQRVVIGNEVRRSSALRQSVLRAAFSGLLSPQVSTDEPAAVLLERIANEQAAAPIKPKRAPKRKSKQPA